MVTTIKKGASAKEIKKLLAKRKKTKGIDAFKYTGSIKLQEDALVIQRKMRDEWR